MSIEGQRVQSDRYTVVPRTLCFLTHSGQILLLRLNESRGAWAGLLNGIGGHIEQGEDPLSSAQREIWEETGLSPGRIRLCGVVLVDVGTSPGIGLYVFVGEASEENVTAGAEGDPEWVRPENLASLPLVEDLPDLLPKALACYRDGSVFSASYRYDDTGHLTIRFSE
jgi:8-oxo-dGTP diphosphatase